MLKTEIPQHEKTREASTCHVCGRICRRKSPRYRVKLHTSCEEAMNAKAAAKSQERLCPGCDLWRTLREFQGYAHCAVCRSRKPELRRERA